MTAGMQDMYGLNKQKYINTFDRLMNDSIITRVSKIIYSIGLIAVFVWVACYVWAALTDPYPIEFREGAPLLMTQYFLKGDNPFLMGTHPLMLNNYGFVYSLVALPFAAIFGNILIVYRTISTVFIALSFLLICYTVYHLNCCLLLTMAASGLSVLGLFAIGGLGAFPSAVGEFLFLTAVLIPWNRSFDPPSLIMSAGFCLAAFYTKPYFVLSFGIVASYVFLFVSKKKGLVYGILFLSILLASVGIVHTIFEMYFLDTFISNLHNASRNILYLIFQLYQFTIEYLPCIAVGMSSALITVLENKHEKHIQTQAKLLVDFVHLDHPFFHIPFNYFLYFLICGLSAIILSLGLHLGAYMNYLYQLIVPPTLLLVVSLQVNRSKQSVPLIMPFILLNMIVFCLTCLNLPLAKADTANWERLYGYLQKSKQVLNSPLLTPEMVQMEIPPVDSGQSEYYLAVRSYERSFLVPDYQAVKNRGNEYLQTIADKIHLKQFDYIMINEGHSPFASEELIRKTYRQIETLKVNMPKTGQKWNIEVWEPKGAD
jgi:hypothetical protein